MIATLIFVPAGILEYGFVSSLIHEETPELKDYRSVFRINVKMVVLYIPLGFLLTMLLVWWYQVTQYVYYFLLLMPILFFTAYNSVNSAGLRKELQIKKSALIEFSGTLMLFLVTAGLLYVGWGVKGLIAGQLARAAVISGALATTTSYMRGQENALDSASRQKHWDYGKYVIGEKVMGIGLSHVDVFLVNHFLGAGTLGVYDLLKRMIFRPLVVAYNAMEQVTFPLLSAAVRVPQKFRDVFVSTIRANYIFFLSLLGIFLVEWVLGFLPAEYQGMHRVIELLLILGVSMMILNPVDIVAYSLNRTKHYYGWVVAYGIVQIVVMFVTLQMGLENYLIAMTVFNLLVYVLSYFVVVKRDSGIAFWDWVQPILLFITFMLLLFLI